MLKAKTCNLAETEPLQQISFFKKLFCCSTNKRKIGILEELEKQERTVEILWSYLELSLRGLFSSLHWYNRCRMSITLGTFAVLKKGVHLS